MAPTKALIEITETSLIWCGQSQDERLRLAFVDFARACRQHGVRDLAFYHEAMIRICCFCSCLKSAGNRGQLFNVNLSKRMVTVYSTGVFILWGATFTARWISSQEVDVSPRAGKLSNIGAKALQWGRPLVCVLSYTSTRDFQCLCL